MTDGRSGAGRGARAAFGAALVAVAALALLLAAPARPAAAQTGEQARDFIERTSEVLAQVGEAVRESESERARRVFAEARAQHEMSLRMLDQGRPLLAIGASRRAREAALSAGRLARESLTFEERARLRVERVQDHLEGLVERAREQRNEEALRFLDEGRRQMERAREQYAQKNFEIALNLLQSAEGMLNRGARLLFEQGGTQRLESELEQTAELIARAREAAATRDDRAALDLCGRAEAELDQARAAAAAGEPWRALRFAQQARRLAVRAGEAGAAPVSGQAVREQIARWDERRAALDGRVAGNRRAEALVDRAAGHRRNAQDLLDAGKPEQALRAIKIAHDILSEAGELAR